MKNHRRTLALVLTVILAVCLFALPVMADTTTGGGLELTLTTDKTEYTADEQIVATLTVKNTTDAAITDLIAKHSAPEGYGVAAGTAKKTISSLAAGESVSVEVTYGAGIPTTGDAGIIAAAAAMIVAAGGLLALGKADSKLRKGIISMFLCCIMVAGLAVGASASELTDGITVSTTVKVDGADVTLSAAVTQKAAEEPTEPADPVVYNGLTASQLDAIPGVNAEDFAGYMDQNWNFGWVADTSIEALASKVDLTGTADPASKVWRVGTNAAEGCALIDNAGWGTILWTKGEGNIAYMYNKIDVPETVTQFRVWAVGNTSEHWSGSGAVRAVALYKDDSGNYVKEVLVPTADSIDGVNAVLQADGSVKFTGGVWSMPGTLDGCMIIYNMDNLKGRNDVVIVVESIGVGAATGTADTEAAGGCANGDVMPDVVIVKRIMFL